SLASCNRSDRATGSCQLLAHPREVFRDGPRAMRAAHIHLGNRDGLPGLDAAGAQPRVEQCASGVREIEHAFLGTEYVLHRIARPLLIKLAADEQALRIAQAQDHGLIQLELDLIGHRCPPYGATTRSDRRVKTESGQRWCETQNEWPCHGGHSRLL